MGQRGPAAGVRVALLNQGAQLKPGLRQALVTLGAEIVYETAASLLDDAALAASGARVIVVNLGADDEPIGEIRKLLDAGDYDIVINDTETSDRLGDSEQARWARLLAGKILQRPDFDLPPRPAGAEAVPGSAPTLTDASTDLRNETASALTLAPEVAQSPATPAAEAHADTASIAAPDWSLAPLQEDEPDDAADKPTTANEFGIEKIPAHVYLAPPGTPSAGSGDLDLDFDLVPLEAQAERDPVARELADALRERARTHANPAADAPPPKFPPDKPRKK